MSEQPNIYKIYKITAKLKLNSPLLIADGENDGVIDKHILKNKKGEPFIPGTSLAGALRNLAIRKNKEIAELSKVYKSAKSTQELIKNQMLSNGASYSLIEQMFGEDVSSTIADVYSEMQNYSNTLGRISYQEEHYKKEIISYN